MSAAAADHEPVREETPTTYYEETVRLPGYGQPPDRCRALEPVGFCEHGHTILGRSSCGTRYCPDCWRDWIQEAVISIVARLAAYRHVQEGAEKRLSHVVASPPQDRRYSRRELWDARSDAYDALAAAGVDGGAAVTHAYRTNDRGDRLYEAAVSAGAVEEDTGRWRCLRDMTTDWENLSEYVEAAPHYHTLAAGVDIDGEAAPGDWVVKRIRSFRRFELRDTAAYRDMASAGYYILTHAPVQDGRAATTYFGDVHPTSFDPEEELTAEEWATIQDQAETAVKERPNEERPAADGAKRGVDGRECPRSECEAPVRELMQLREFLEETRLNKGRREDREKYRRLCGVLAWWEKRTDRPPPTVASDRERFRAWFYKRGRVLAPTTGAGTKQAGLGSLA